MRRLAAYAALAALAGCGLAATPSQVLKDPAAYDRELVLVTGTVHGVGTRSGMQTFRLCDASCILVVRSEPAPLKEGATLTVSGRFRIARTAGALAGLANTLLVR